MKPLGFITALLISTFSFAQKKVQVIVPEQPVVVGTAFQVQYVITEPSDLVHTSTPEFDGCNLISGPNVYMGNAVIDGKLQPIQNITYTLVPSRTGVLRIGGIRAMFNNHPGEYSGDAGITVIPQPKASFSVRNSYTDMNLYAPSTKTDRDRLIDENLFIKTEVGKTVCFEGEPIVVKFKLYSRLQSSSEAEKSPAFYGFSVFDMLNTNEAHAAVETVNGKIFNTSVLRQVQLYPVQTGKLIIDEMYVHNEIEFEDSITHEKIKVEKEIVTKPVTVTVRSLPAAKPADYTGAVGKFLMKAFLEKDEMISGGEGKLVVNLEGKGNFVQFGQPVINWPKGIEPFEPVITDMLNKNISPIEGNRTYVFGFAPDAAGRYIIPPLQFSYFDIATGRFEQLTTDTLRLQVLQGYKKISSGIIPPPSKLPFAWIAISILIIVPAVLYFLLARGRKMKKNGDAQPVSTQPGYLHQLAALDQLSSTDSQTCVELQKILAAFSQENQLSLSITQKQELKSIMEDCQLMLYSKKATDEKKESLKLRAARLVSSFSKT